MAYLKLKRQYKDFFLVTYGKKGCHLTFLTHWGRVTHICIGKLTIIGSDNGLLPGRRHAIIWTNAEILLIGPLETNFSEILIEIHTFSFRKMPLKLSSGKWQPFCLSLNVLNASIDNRAVNVTTFPLQCLPPIRTKALIQYKVLSNQCRKSTVKSLIKGAPNPKT